MSDAVHPGAPVLRGVTHHAGSNVRQGQPGTGPKAAITGPLNHRMSPTRQVAFDVQTT